MKSATLSLCLFFQFSIFSQDDAYSFIEKGDFSSADSLLSAHSTDPSYFFNFDIFYPLSQALNEHQKSKEFIDYELENGGKLKNLFDFYGSYIQLKQKKISKLDFDMVYKEISTELVPSSYSFYGMLSSIQFLKSDAKVTEEMIQPLLADFETKWNDFITTDASENIQRFGFLRSFIQYQFNKLRVEYGLQPNVLLLETKISFDQQQALGCITFFREVWGDFDVFKEKYLILKDMTTEDQNKWAASILCESPTKKNLTAVKKGYKHKQQLIQDLAVEFDKTNAKIEFSDSIQQYISAHSDKTDWIIIDIWGTWCGPCVAELPTWQEFANKHADANFSLLLLSAFSKDWKEFLEKNEYRLPNQELSEDEIKNLGINSFPTTYLISPNGNAAIIPFGIEKREYISVILGL